MLYHEELNQLNGYDGDMNITTNASTHLLSICQATRRAEGIKIH